MSLKLGYVQPYWDYHHGRTICTSKNIDGNYMIIYTLELDEFNNQDLKTYKDIAMASQIDSIRTWKQTYNSNINNTIRNIEEIYTNPKNTNIEVIQVIQLSGLEQIAIIKTIWLKLLQRKFKKHYKNKMFKD